MIRTDSTSGLAQCIQREGSESALLRELESFLLELGTDFAFLSRQKRLTIDGRDYIDLLFFHRRLRRLVAIELKIGEFQAADKGQMELYLRWLAKYEQAPARCAAGFDPNVLAKAASTSNFCS